MDKHTPGPWAVKIIDTVNDAPAYWHITDSCRGVVGDVQSVNPFDARLIAAAPEMFELLYTVLPYIEDLELDQMYKPGVVAALTRRIRDTLDKAEGVQP